MKIKLTTGNGSSFLKEIGKRKRVIEMVLDNETFEPTGSIKKDCSVEDYREDDFWSIVFHLNNAFGIPATIEFEFMYNEDGEKSLLPINFLLWDDSDKGGIVDERPFKCEIVRNR